MKNYPFVLSLLVARACAVGAWGIGALALFGHAFDWRSLLDWKHAHTISLPTTIAVFLLGTSMNIVCAVLIRLADSGCRVVGARIPLGMPCSNCELPPDDTMPGR